MKLIYCISKRYSILQSNDANPFGGDREVDTSGNPSGGKSFQCLSRFQYCFDNAKNDPKAPTFCFGLFKGYLAFDTGQPFHYMVH